MAFWRRNKGIRRLCMALMGTILACAAAFAALMGYVVYREAALPLSLIHI